MTDITKLPIKLDLEGTNNFRELGGYPCIRGGFIRQGLLFRSDHLGKLTSSDQQQLNKLGIKTVVDLRCQAEREETPDRIDNPAIQQLWMPVSAEGADVHKLRRGLESGEITAELARQYLLEANREFVRDFSHIYKDFLELLLERSNYPLVFHCTAGKDRAGFAAALSLLVAGASLETVFHDYLATNHCTANYVNGLIDGLADMPEMKASPDAVRTLMQVEVHFIQAAFDTINEQYESMNNYLEKALGIDADKRGKIRSILCE